MAKKAYIGVDGVARKVKKGYLGVDGVARKIKKAYIGIGGVARPCWSGGEPSYYGTIDGLYEAVSNNAATSVGDYAVFMGGQNASYYATAKITRYDKSLTRNTSYTGYISYNHSATSVGSYALFAGGDANVGSGTKYLTKVHARNESFTSSSPSVLSKGRYGLKGATVGGTAFFSGGWNNYADTTVDAYDSSLSKTTPTRLTNIRFHHGGTSVGNYVIFAGGKNNQGAALSSVETYTESGTHGSASDLSTGMGSVASTGLGDYALFANNTTVNAYNKSLTRSNAPSLSNSISAGSASTCNGFAFFCGGSYETVDCYDKSLTKVNTFALSQARNLMSAVTIGNYVLFGGGEKSDTKYSTVDVFTVN